MVWTLLIVVGIVIIGVGVLSYRNRPQKGIESGISSFQRELSALAPRDGRPNESATEPVTTDDDESDDGPAAGEDDVVDDEQADG